MTQATGASITQEKAAVTFRVRTELDPQVPPGSPNRNTGEEEKQSKVEVDLAQNEKESSSETGSAAASLLGRGFCKLGLANISFGA